MCSLGCLPRPPFHRKALSQIEHYKGFSPSVHNHFQEKKLVSQPGCTAMASHQYVFSGVIKMLFKKKQAYQNSSIGMVSSPNVSSCDFKVLPQLLHCYSI